MKFAKNLLFYFSMVIGFGALIAYLLHVGKSLEPARSPAPAASALHSPGSFFSQAIEPHLSDSLPQLLLQIVVIIACTWLLGTAFRKIGQPAVIGETVAGIILGPSLLGLIFPDAFHFLFPAGSMDNLKFLSQIGLILFMFIVGMELDTRLIRKQALEAVIISHASILIPYALGVGVSLLIYNQ